MYQNSGMYANYEVESNKETYKETKTNYQETNAGSIGCMMNPPVYECPEERIIHREIVHEVPHIVPINTRIINHHIYKHTYSPCYTCCEENEVCNVCEGPCSKF